MPRNIVAPLSGSATMPKPTRPLPVCRAGVSGLKPKALAAAGQASSSASRMTRSPARAFISAWQ